MATKPHPQQKSQISQLVTWHFWSSIFFEGLKAGHQACLFILLPTQNYTTIGAIFSLIYLSAHLSGFEGGSALIPFASSIANSADRHKIVSRYLVIPQIILQTMGAIAIHINLTSKFIAQSPATFSLYITLLTAISVLEGLRMALRAFAHTIIDSRKIIPFETGITIAYFIFIWTGYLIGMPLTITSLLIPYLVMSITATSYLLNAIYHYPTRLPKMQNPILPTPYQNIRLRISLTMLHLPRNLFSANLLVPFFAHINVTTAGFIKLASSAAQAVRSIVKGTIGFSANAIFSIYISSRSQAFNMLWDYLITGATTTVIITGLMITPCFILNIMQEEALIVMSFSIMCMLDYLFILYEHFFIVANTSGIIARYRVIETAASAILLWFAQAMPATVIGGLIILRGMALATTIYRAHTLWRIKPKVKLSIRKVRHAFVVGLMMAGCSTYIKLKVKRNNESAPRPTPLFLES